MGLDPSCPARPRGQGGTKAEGCHLQTDGTARIPACRGCTPTASTAREGRAGWFLSRGVRGLRGAQPLSSEARKLLGMEGLTGRRVRKREKSGRNPSLALLRVSGDREVADLGSSVSHGCSPHPCPAPGCRGRAALPALGSFPSLAGDLLSSSSSQTRLPITPHSFSPPCLHSACIHACAYP